VGHPPEYREVFDRLKEFTDNQYVWNCVEGPYQGKTFSGLLSAFKNHKDQFELPRK
jgi:hypothetical protein